MGEKKKTSSGRWGNEVSGDNQKKKGKRRKKRKKTEHTANRVSQKPREGGMQERSIKRGEGGRGMGGRDRGTPWEKEGCKRGR